MQRKLIYGKITLKAQSMPISGTYFPIGEFAGLFTEDEIQYIRKNKLGTFKKIKN